jgi:hypothetical protein
MLSPPFPLSEPGVPAPFGLEDVMCHQEDRRAYAHELAHLLPQKAPPQGVDIIGGLIQNDDPAGLDRGHAEGHQAAHAAGKGLGRLARPFVHLQLLEEIPGPRPYPGGVTTAHAADQLDGLPGRQAADRHLGLRLERTRLPGISGTCSNVNAVDGDAASVGPDQADDLADQCSLAGPVGPQ